MRPGKRGGGTNVAQAHGGAVASNPPHVRDEKIAARVRLGRSIGMSAELIGAMINPPLGKDTILKYYRHEFDFGLIEANMRIGAAVYSAGVGEEVRCVREGCDGGKLPTGRVCEDCKGKGSIWVREPNTTAQIWWSKNMMGWSDQQRIEHTGPGGGPILTEQVSSADNVRNKLERIRQNLEKPKAAA